MFCSSSRVGTPETKQLSSTESTELATARVAATAPPSCPEATNASLPYFFLIAIIACGALRNISELICWVTYNVVDFLMAFSYMCVCELTFPEKKIGPCPEPSARVID